ncbi:hypothetical protein [Parvibacter caecicola]|uniref:hypothetical protein n=1 Tax=Parvibacter caecicola TaxID=747645 RepID=UPI002731774C|nr:hypothetical protein [Parvibacter caecicola]
MQVHVGKPNKSEVDFVAEKDGRRCCIQAAYVMAGSATVDRELGVLETIDDGCPKYMVSMGPVVASENSITHLKLTDS